MTLRRTVPILLVILLTGCGLFRRQQKNYYSLDTIPPATPPAAITGLPIGLDAVELPPGIDRREIVVRQANGQLDLRGTELWSAPVESMIIHTLAFDLAARLPEGMIVLPGQAKPIGAIRSIYVVAEKFEAGPEAVLILDTRWILRAAAAGRSDFIRHERITVQVSSLESTQIASAMSQALATLADRIVAALGAQ